MANILKKTDKILQEIEMEIAGKAYRVIERQVSLSLLQPNWWNPNSQNEFVFDKLKGSIKHLGFIEPILVRPHDKYYQIIDGEHRFKAMKELKQESVVVWDLGAIDDSTAIVISLNKNNLRGWDDPVKRGELFGRLDSKKLDLLPVTKKDIADEIKLLTWDWSIFDRTPFIDETKMFLDRTMASAKKFKQNLEGLKAKKSQEKNIKALSKLIGEIDKFINSQQKSQGKRKLK